MFNLTYSQEVDSENNGYNEEIFDTRRKYLFKFLYLKRIV